MYQDNGEICGHCGHARLWHGKIGKCGFRIPKANMAADKINRQVRVLETPCFCMAFVGGRRQ